ncbi:hypothetical protein SARC_07304 [Sphaeroforma arctica JP610]|uniref:Dynamin stalk domain-containing protein n=1 Tax=Sphaeroforma arctica JP610 TaxID=667725 RepID=A0A0L0FUI6_9EUKA|nr:hypothetical protein SARC_07304 [Sphaeroforma arctica JP610]KNC80329.1 hypothetical protein SARC_07304 [Sphaeroforma arctica JP610]|eukprot:XP_014154231.1 hypothetical protein SARC_07304 [Sphaeroforma arctica JP610]
MTIAGARVLESEFFRCNLKTLPGSACGTAALSSRLVANQYKHIKDTLPIVAKKVLDKISELEDKVSRYGDMLLSEYECIRIFETNLHATLDELAFQCSGHGRSRHLKTPAALDINQNLELVLAVPNPIKHATKTQPHNQQLHSMELSPETTTSHTNFFGASIEVYAYAEKHSTMKQTFRLILHCALPGYIKACKLLWAVEEIHENGTKLPVAAYEHKFTTTGEIGKDNMPICNEDRKFIFDVQLIYVGYKNTREGAVKEVEHTLMSFAKADKTTLLCSTLDTKDTAIATSLTNRFHAQLFFTKNMHMVIKGELENRKGLEGLPGVISSHVALQVMEKLNTLLADTVDDYLDGVSKPVAHLLQSEFKSSYARYPRLCAMIATIVTNISVNHLRTAREKAHELLAYETQMMTRNHYFMDTVQSLRQQLMSDETTISTKTSTPDICIDDPELAGEVPVFTQRYMRHVRGMSNSDQRIVDLQIEIFAYFKVLRKRLVDYVTMCAVTTSSQCLSCIKKVKNEIRKGIEDHCSSAGTGYIKLMGASEGDQREVASLKSRLSAMREAHQELTVAVQSNNIVDV